MRLNGRGLNRSCYSDGDVLAHSTSSVPDIQRGTVRSGDVNIAYAVQGQGARTVLLVMGLGGREADWGDAFPAQLARKFRVVRFDNRGTGASDKPRDGWTLEDMARDATAVLDAVGAERAHVVGVSMGGMISQLVALDHPERVDHLVLMSTHFGGHGVDQPAPEVLAIFVPPREMPRDEMMRNSMRMIMAPHFAAEHPEVVEELVRLALEAPTPKRAFAAQLQAILSSDRSGRVSSIRAPTLVVHGDLDPLVPYSNGRRLAESIPGARLATLPGCGHMLMWESADELARVVLEFLPA